MARSTHSFESSTGHQIAGTLSKPEGRLRAVALFAHCFTCTQSSLAAVRIVDALASRGIATMRFDFTGLGKSGGDFAQAGFASNVDDLVAAAAFLKSTIGEPSLLVGHSLGGAAVLVAAGRIEGLRAVATIGAPSDAVHVLKAIDGDLDQIRRDGSGEVRIAGRSFPLSADFIQQASEANVLKSVAALRLPLMIAHAPRDAVVSIDHAGKIFGAAKHPKSFLSLDDADHLLTKAADAEWAAGVIAKWLTRYLPIPEHDEDNAPAGVQVRSSGLGLAVDIVAGRHHWRGDEPVAVGGADSGPTPYDLLLAGLGACTAMTIRMVADREKLPVGEIEVALSHDRNHARDCDHCDSGESRIEAVIRTISVTGTLDATQRARVMDVAKRCPVHRTLTGELHIHDTAAPSLSSDANAAKTNMS